MFRGKDYWERLNLQKVCNFLLYGDDEQDLDTNGTPVERVKRYEKDFLEGLLLYRDRVLEFDWSSIGDDDFKRTIATEDLYVEALDANSDLNDLYYEMGFYAALVILFNMDVDPEIMRRFETCKS